MITKFLKKRNVNPNLPFSKNFARIQVHPNGSHSFKFTKRQGTTPPAVDLYLRPDGISQYLRPDGTSTYNRP